jgi:hypothetical protein
LSFPTFIKNLFFGASHNVGVFEPPGDDSGVQAKDKEMNYSQVDSEQAL